MINIFLEKMSDVRMILHRRSREGVYGVRLAVFLHDCVCSYFRMYIYTIMYM